MVNDLEKSTFVSRFLKQYVAVDINISGKQVALVIIGVLALLNRPLAAGN